MELWNKNQLNVTLSTRLTLKVAQKIHFIPESEKLEVFYGEVFLSDLPLGWMEYGAGFRVSKVQPIKQTWTTENRLMVFADFTKTIDAFRFTFGNRFEYRNFSDLSDLFRYKQTFTLQFPNLTGWGIQFYASEETFFKLNDGKMNLARFFSGLHVLKTEHFRLSVYYGLQKTKVINKWYSSDIIGMNLRYAI